MTSTTQPADSLNRAESRLLLPAPQPVSAATVPPTGLTDQEIARFIERMKISADAKARLMALARVTMKVGRKVTRIGRKIISVLISFVRSFPAISFGVIFAFVIGTLLSSVPVLGSILGPIAMTLGTALGVLVGARIDIQNADLASRMAAFVTELQLSFA
jgi:uncharacterized membrane protein